MIVVNAVNSNITYKFSQSLLNHLDLIANLNVGEILERVISQ